MKQVYDAGGIKIQGLGNRKGKRYDAPAVDPRGGKRTRSEEPAKAPWYHPDAEAGENEKVAMSTEKYQKKIDRVNSDDK